MKLENLKWTEVQKLAPNSIALVPIAAIEQHGHHLPLVTDTVIGTELAQRIERTFPKKIVLLPTFWIGSSHHHMEFPGTMSLQNATYIQVLVEILESIENAGFKKAILFNSHGGNHLPATEALYRFCIGHPARDHLQFVLATYWNVAADVLRKQKFMKTSHLTHACEYETSMMLTLRSEQVDMRKAHSKVKPFKSDFFNFEGIPGFVTMINTYKGMTTARGSMGSPQFASREKGRKLLDLIERRCCDFVREFQRW